MSHVTRDGDLAEQASWIGHLLMERYCGRHGMLAQVVDGQQGTIIRERPLIDELGDYAQYVLMLGQLQGDATLVDWAKGQVQRALTLGQTADGVIYSMRRNDGRGRPQGRYCSLLHLGDTVWGLVETYVLLGDQSLKEDIDRFYDAIFRYGYHEGFLVYGFIPMERWSLKVPLSDPMTAGYFMEPLVYLYISMGEEIYLERARTTLAAWVSTPSFRSHGLFSRVSLVSNIPLADRLIDSQFRWRGRPGLDATLLVKGDTYLIFALLALFRVTREDWVRETVLRWRSALVEQMRTDDGRFYIIWDRGKNTKTRVTLGEDHSVIEALLDIYYDLGDEHSLPLAMMCADAWLQRRTELGVIPNRDGTSWCLLDPQVDFAINLLKLAELTGLDRYRESALDLLGALLSWHTLPYGFAEAVHGQTGEPLSGRVETKFLGLMIKGLLVFHHVLAGRRVFDSAPLRRLATDR